MPKSLRRRRSQALQVAEQNWTQRRAIETTGQGRTGQQMAAATEAQGQAGNASCPANPLGNLCLREGRVAALPKHLEAGAQISDLSGDWKSH